MCPLGMEGGRVIACSQAPSGRTLRSSRHSIQGSGDFGDRRLHIPSHFPCRMPTHWTTTHHPNFPRVRHKTTGDSPWACEIIPISQFIKSSGNLNKFNCLSCRSCPLQLPLVTLTNCNPCGALPGSFSLLTAITKKSAFHLWCVNICVPPSEEISSPTV